MRKALTIAGGVLLILAALLAVAIFNLNHIISENKAYALARISAALGRDVQIGAVKASLGWGVILDVSGIKIADDQAFSQSPIIEASEVYGQAEILPLLTGHLHLRRLVFVQPQLRLIRSEGRTNLSELGAKPKTGGPAGEKSTGAPTGDEPSAEKPTESEPASQGTAAQGESNPSPSLPAIERFAIDTFSIRAGTLWYTDLSTIDEPTPLNVTDLEVSHFSATNPFGVEGKFANAENDQELNISGQIGPLVRDGNLDAAAIPVDLQFSTNPLLLERLRRILLVNLSLPPDFTISDFFQVAGTLNGSLGKLQFDLGTDMSAPAVALGNRLNKPAGMPLKLSLTGWRDSGGIAVQQVALTLANLELKLGNIHTVEGVVQARIDTNRFDLSGVVKTVPRAADFGDASGDAEIHADLSLKRRHLEAQGTVALANVAMTPKDGAMPPISNLTTTVRMTGNGASIESTAFDLGSGHAKLQAEIGSFTPLLVGNFSFNDDLLELAGIVPPRKSEGPQELRQLAMSGTLGGTTAHPTLDASGASAAGNLSNVEYRDLSFTAAYANDRAEIKSLKVNAFGGAIAASGSATMTAARPFDATLNLGNIDLQAALASQKAKAAGTIRGSLTGQIQISGNGTKSEQIMPALRGGGKAALQNGKLVGINIVAEALKKSHGIPGIGGLVTPDIVARHPELFAAPDTDISAATLSFTITGPRIVSHDIAIQSPDYKLLGDGSFDADRNIDMKAQVVLTKELSGELEANKKAVVYLTNANGEVEIPLQIVGTLPKPQVLPDLQALAQTAAQHMFKGKAGKLLGGMLGKKGNGLGGLEKLFH